MRILVGFMVLTFVMPLLANAQEPLARWPFSPNSEWPTELPPGFPTEGLTQFQQDQMREWLYRDWTARIAGCVFSTNVCFDGEQVFSEGAVTQQANGLRQCKCDPDSWPLSCGWKKEID